MNRPPITYVLQGDSSLIRTSATFEAYVGAVKIGEFEISVDYHDPDCYRYSAEVYSLGLESSFYSGQGGFLEEQEAITTAKQFIESHWENMWDSLWEVRDEPANTQEHNGNSSTISNND